MDGVFRSVLRSVVVVLSLLVPGLPVAAAEPVCGDVNSSGGLSASDALLVLRAAVGQPVGLQCPPAATVLQTGQDTCHDTTGAVVACAGTGQDAEWKKGIVRQLVDNGDGTVTDIGTGLTWEKLSDDGGIHDRDDTWTWTEAVTGKIAALNAASFAGHQDWRLPNIRELESLTDYGRFSPAIVSAFDNGCQPGCAATECSCTLSEGSYWSSTTYESDPLLAWVVFLPNGATSIAYTPEGALSVRAVRGGL